MAKVAKRLVGKKVYVTSEGLAKARQDLEFLKTVKRTEVSQRIQGAESLGIYLKIQNMMRLLQS